MKIQLRVWDKGQMIYNNYIAVSSDASNVSQFTGIVDKSGNNIYTGDIVRDIREFGEDKRTIGRAYVVEYIVDDAGYFPFSKPAFGGLGFYSLKGCEVEIMGNIFENPELLEK